jgi:subtilisin family serine protease
VGVLVVVSLIITPRGGPFAATADPTRRIVLFGAGTSLATQEQLVTALGGQILHELTLINALAVQFSLGNLTTILQSLLSNPTVVGVYDDSIAMQDLETVLTSELNPPPGTWFEWGENHMHVPPVYSNGIRGSGVTVAVLDTGMDFTHPNLAANILGGFNAIAVGPGGSYYDDNGLDCCTLASTK